MRAEDVEGLTVGVDDRNLRYTCREFKEVVEECARALMALGLQT